MPIPQPLSLQLFFRCEAYKCTLQYLTASRRNTNSARYFPHSFLLFHNDKRYLIYCKKVISDKLSALGLKLSAKKTQIYPVSQPIHFLGFSFKLTGSGKVLMFVLSKKVTHERRKLRKLVKLCGQQVLTREDVDKCYTAWMAHACKGNSYNLINSMTAYYNSLWR